MHIAPLTPHIGAEVTGVDLTRPIDADFARTVRQALLDHMVLVFRDQAIGDEDQVAFSRAFGPLEIFVQTDMNDRRLPEVMAVVDAGDTTKYVSIAQYWHTDGSYKPVPAYITTLRALEMCPEGGETCFANTCAGYEALPDAMKQRIDGLEAVHDLSHSRSLVPNLSPMTEEQRAKVPPTAHPLARVHSGTGRKALYLGNHIREVVGLPPEQGQSLVRELTEWTTRPEFVYEHKWRPGDLVVWDNRGTMHRVKPYDATRHRRVMHRTEVSGSAAA